MTDAKANDGKKEEVKLNIVNVDLLKSGCDVLLQQNNCLRRRAHGLSKTIAQKYKYADPYSRRSGSGNTADAKSRPPVGSILVMKPDLKFSNGPVVIAMMAQLNHGKADIGTDRALFRQKWFLDCLTRVLEWVDAKEPGTIKTVGVPFKIGCGLAGGDWTAYSKLLLAFQLQLASRSIQLLVCRLE